MPKKKTKMPDKGTEMPDKGAMWFNVAMAGALLYGGLEALSEFSGMWREKEGFLWGFLIVVGFDGATLCITSGLEKARRVLFKMSTVNDPAIRLVSILFSGLAVFVGYKTILIGWCHWWNGFFESLFLGLPGLLTGGGLFVSSIQYLMVAVLPRSVSDKFLVKWGQKPTISKILSQLGTKS